ncbi:MAG: cytochrome c biogenesis protein CcsA [Polyangiaceae bacterium]
MTTTITHISLAIAILLYASASMLFYAEVARRASPESGWHRWAPALLGTAAATHLVYVLLASVVAKICPVHSVHFFLSIASLLATTVYLLARRRFRVRALGLIVAPIGLVLILGTHFLGTASPARRLPASFIGLHVFANLIGDALFLLAFGAAVMYLLQDRRLKSKRGLDGARLPPLEALDRATHRFLLAGFPLLTLGVISGSVWSARLELGAPDVVLRTVFGYATWLLIASVLLLRVVAGWRGRKAAYGTVVGFACAVIVLVTYLVRPAFREGAALLGG